MAAKAEGTRESAEHRLVITRVLDAPREVVFKAWTDPKLLKQWWGPKGFTNPVCELDVRPGGAIRVHMRGPDGTVYPMGGMFHEIVEPERIVFTSTAMEDEWGEPQLEVFNTVTFAEHNGKTRLTLHAEVVKSGPGTDRALAGMEQGWTETLERLEQFTATGKSMMDDSRTDLRNERDEASSTAGREITVTRIIDAPRETVFEMWTNPKHIAEWWGPQGFTNTIEQMDVRPGGVWRFVMHGPNGVDHQNEIVYREVVRPERLVYSHLSEPHFDVTVNFGEEGDKTKLALRMVFESAELRDKVAQEFRALEGVNQTIDRLEELVKTNRKS